MNKLLQEKLLFNVKELAQLTGISEKSIYKGISRKAEKPFPIRHKRAGKSILFPSSDIQSWMDQD